MMNLVLYLLLCMFFLFICIDRIRYIFPNLIGWITFLTVAETMENRMKKVTKYGMPIMQWLFVFAFKLSPL